METAKSQSITRSSYAFMGAAVAFVMILTNTDALAIPGSWISMILLAAALLWLRSADGDVAGTLGRNLLLLAAVGGPVSLFVSFAVGAVTGNLSPAGMASSGFWVLIFVGPVVPLLGLTLFGLTALPNHAIAGWKWLAVLAGIWYPVAFSILAGYLFTHHGRFPLESYGLLQIMFAAQFVALLALGAGLLNAKPADVAGPVSGPAHDSAGDS